MKNEKLSIDTIAYCVTAIICTIILSVFYLKANRYVPMSGTNYIIDQKEDVLKRRSLRGFYEYDLNKTEKVGEEQSSASAE